MALEILPCGLILTKTIITHHQVTPVPDLGSEHIHGVSQVIPRRVLQTPSAMQETQETRVQSLGWEDPLEEEMATHSPVVLPGESHGQELVGYGGRRSQA